MLKFNSFLIYYNMKIYRFLQKKQIYVQNIQNITTDDFVYKTFIFMSQLLCKQYHMPFESNKPITINNRPWMRVFNIIALQGGPMQNINLLFKCFKANYKKSYFCNVACWLKIKKTERHFLRHVAATIMWQASYNITWNDYIWVDYSNIF